MIKYLGTTSKDRVTIVERLGDEGYVIGGTKVIGTSNNFYLARLNFCGDVLWENLYEDGTYGLPAGVVFKDGFIYVSAYSGSPLRTSLVKIDLDGNVISAEKFGASSTYPRRMRETNDGNFVYCGVTAAPGGPGANDYFITKSTPDGTILWNKQLGGISNDLGHNISQAADGSFLAVGYTKDYFPGIRRGLIIKTDDSGNITWSKEIHNGAGFTYVAFAEEIDGFYYFTGYGNNGGIGNDDGLIVKTTTEGEVIWSKFIGTTENDRLFDFAEKDGLLYISGSAYSPTKGIEATVMTMDFDGNLLDYTSFGTVNDEFNFLDFHNFGVESDGFYGVTGGNTGMIGDDDIIFYRFNTLADNCEPSDVELEVIDAGMISEDLSTSSVSPTWTFSPFIFSPDAVPENHGIICSTVEPIACDSLIIIEPLTDLCIEDEITLEASSINGGTISWDMDVINGDSFAPPLGTTIYTATSDTTADCLFSIEITVSPLPTVVANVDDDELCLGESAVFTGTGADLYDWNMTVTDGITFEPTEIGGAWYTVTGTDVNECTNIDSIMATVHEIPTADIEFIAAGTSSEIGGTGGCYENAVQFNDLSTIPATEIISAWNWDFGDSNTSTDQNPSHTYSTAGTYTVTLTITSDAGCTSTYSIPITMTELTLSLVTVEPSCYGYDDGSLTVTAIGGTGMINYEIKDEADIIRNIANSNTASSLGIGLYTIIITDEEGCSATSSTYLDQPDSLIADFSFAPTEPKLGELVSFYDLTSGAVTWEWDFGDGTNSNAENPTHTYNSLGTYTITLIVSDGNCESLISKTITITDKLIYFVPNSFTPDGDVYNNTFKPIFTSGFDPYDYHLTIFNRWGEIIFESYNSQIGWDGTYQSANLVQSGVYIWQIEFADAVSDEQYIERGHVTILK